MRGVVAAALVLVAGCGAAPGRVAPAPAPASVPVVVKPEVVLAPEDRAREIIDGQIAAARQGDDGFEAMFAPSARIHGAHHLARATIRKIVAGGTADAVWFHATLDGGDAITYAGVATRATGWKVVGGVLRDASHVIHSTGRDDPPANGTPLGPVMALLVDGPGLARAMAPDAIVVYAGLGPLAREPVSVQRGPEALGTWGTRTLVYVDGLHEAAGDGWAFAEGRVVLRGVRLQLFAVAIPAPAGGWTPVLVDYDGVPDR